MKSTHLLVAAVLIFTTFAPGASAGDLTVLSEQAAGGPPATALHRRLMKDVEAARLEWEKEYEARTTPEQIAAYQKQMRRNFVEAIGGLPKRSPLNARITGTIQRDGYSVEKVLFESEPGVYVTAALFLPDPAKFPKPWPAFIVPCGHSESAKLYDGYQTVPAVGALNGMAGLVFDPIDQGERIQTYDPKAKWNLMGTKAHNVAGLSAMPLGWGVARFFINDGMRAIDYLQSRDDIDGSRIGVTGNSGGGTQTSYLMALDDRITAAAPNCYLTRLPILIDTIGPQDAEQDIFGQLAFGMDHPDYVMMRAPVPILMGVATKDFFDITGAWQNFRYAKRLYSRMGHAERISIAENDDKHGWKQPLREQSVRWMSRWLRGVDEPITEPGNLKLLSKEEIQVTPEGQVMLLPGARSVFDVMQDEAKRLAEARKGTKVTPKLVREVAGFRALKDLPKVEPSEAGEMSRDWGHIRKLVFDFEGMPLPALLYQPANASAPGTPVLYVHGEGKAAAHEAAEALARQGRIVLSVDLRGWGETEREKANFYGEKDGGDAYTAYLLGKSLVGMRAEDVLVTARWLKDHAKADRGPEVIAATWAVTPALHAAVAEPKLIESIEVIEPPITWSQVIQQRARHRASDLVHGALKHYDQPELLRALK